jgi:hypothetical protein
LSSCNQAFLRFLFAKQVLVNAGVRDVPHARGNDDNARDDDCHGDHGGCSFCDDNDRNAGEHGNNDDTGALADAAQRRSQLLSKEGLLKWIRFS